MIDEPDWNGLTNRQLTFIRGACDQRLKICNRKDQNNTWVQQGYDPKTIESFFLFFLIHTLSLGNFYWTISHAYIFAINLTDLLCNSAKLCQKC